MSSDSWAVNAALVTTSALALAANSLLILVFFRRRGLRTVSNRFVINLLVTNLLSSLVLIPLLLADQELKEDFPVQQNLVIKDLNSSSQLSIENIQLKFEKPNTSATPVFEELLDEDFELEILNIRDSTVEEENRVKIREFRTVELGNESLGVDENEFLCYMAEGSTSLVCTASILSILLIAIDQYFAVTHPLRYHTFIDKFKSLKLLVTTWVLSFLFGILGSFVRTDSNLWNFCTKNQIEKSDIQIYFNIIYSFIYLSLITLVPFLIICVIYGCIYCAAHKNSERMRKSNSGSSSTNLDLYVQIPLDENRFRVKVNSSDNLTIENELPTLPKVKSAPNFANLEKQRLNSLPNIMNTETTKVTHENSLRSNSSFINNLKSKISNASLFRYREETRAAKISILVIFMVLVCYVPYGIALILNTKIFSNPPVKCFNSLSLSLLVLANLLSPFLFAYRNRRIQRELRRLFGLLPTRVPRELKSIRERRSSIYQPRELQQFNNETILENVVPEVVVNNKEPVVEKKSILKRVCSKGKTWSNTAKKCNFLPVESCLSAECRCSFSSASTQDLQNPYIATLTTETSTEPPQSHLLDTTPTTFVQPQNRHLLMNI